MISTVVGSFPANIKPPKTIIGKIKNALGSFDSYKIAIKEAVEAQVGAGIDIISDGQVRGDMVTVTASNTIGFSVEGNSSKIVSKIMPNTNSTGFNSNFQSVIDLKYAKSIMDNLINDMGGSGKIDVVNLKNKGDNNPKYHNGVKGILTGPSTMIFSSFIESYYNKGSLNKNSAILDMAKVLKVEAIALEDAGATLIQIDEPFLSTGMVDMDVAKKAINIISSELSIPVSIHCCGDISDVFQNLLDFNVDIIDCEFAGFESNVDVLDSYSNNLNGKKIGFGCIDTKRKEIETVDEVARLIKRGIDIVGFNNLYIDPDCGMRLFSKEVAVSKLNNMVQAMNSLDNLD
ncbi:MAG: methionine synthase [Methanobacteriaceae archaeon]